MSDNIDEVLKAKLEEQKRISEEIENLKIEKQKQKLISKRDSLQKELSQLQQQRNKIDVRIKSINDKLSEISIELNDVSKNVPVKQDKVTKQIFEDIPVPTQKTEKIVPEVSQIPKSKEEEEENEPVSLDVYDYNDVFSWLADTDEEVYGLASDIEIEGTRSLDNAFEQLGYFLDIVTTKILIKYNIDSDLIVSKDEDLLTKINEKFGAMYNNDLFLSGLKPIDYKCEALKDTDDPYIQASNSLLYLVLLYKSSALPNEQQNGTWPVHDNEAMNLCVQAMSDVLNGLYKE